MKTALKDALAYLWDGWGAAVGLLMLIALWELGHTVYGSFVLPAPIETVESLASLQEAGKLGPAAWTTALRAIGGFLAAGLVGSLFGIVAGLSMTSARAVRPIVTVLLGVPPIAWIVLALLWFGPGGMTPVFTVVVTALPITFAAAVEGSRTLDQGLEDMARVFNAPFLMVLWEVHLPHILSYLFPAWITALGMAWKVAVMAELMASDSGIGAEMALARVNLETGEAMAWVIAVVGLLLAAEYLVLEPIKRKIEPWRRTGQGRMRKMGGF